MVWCRSILAFQFGHDLHRKHLAEFDTPLVERIDLPDCALNKHGMFVEGDQFA